MGKIKEEKLRNIGFLALRLAVGAIFIATGWAKLTGIDPIVGMMGSIGLPGPTFWAYLVAIVEFLGGIALILGVYLRCFAKLLAIIMLVAILTVKAKSGFKAARLDIALLGANIALAALGGGSWQLIKKECFSWCGICKMKEE
ncbi:MAG: DoxX family protein [Candidatus Magasanikbacteria bacterium]